MKQTLIVPSMMISGEMTDANMDQILAYDRNGADALLLFDLSEDDAAHEEALLFLRAAARKVDIPIICGIHTPRFEDVKKYLYAGASKALVDMRPDSGIDVLKEASARFGKEKVAAYTETVDDYFDHADAIKEYASLVVSQESIDTEGMPVLLITNNQNMEELVKLCEDDDIVGISGESISENDRNLTELKSMLKASGCEVNVLESPISFADFKLNGDGLIPVVVQDYQTSQVLMLAYMNEEAFNDTLRTGKMCYYSRSRKTQWMKGETSGHFQYVKALHLDCDNDTLLAKVAQIGPACHTGSTSCFFKEIVQKNYSDSNPLAVFEDVYATIMDRKEHPKEGSYTNYLFEKGIDKILKKVGEEATEIVIAAKNPEPEEIKYEIADFLYHVMVLMAQKGVTWQEIAEELANRE